MAEIMWHRRETRRQTENTNIMPVALEGLILLDENLANATALWSSREVSFNAVGEKTRATLPLKAAEPTGPLICMALRYRSDQKGCPQPALQIL